MMRPKPHRGQYKIERLRERKAVTIALGFTCIDGVVLAADRQITKEGGLKYEQDKILFGGTISGDMKVDFALAYAGSPDLAKNLLDQIGLSVLGVCNGDVFARSSFENAIRQVLTPKDTRGLETLITFGGPNIRAFMFRTRETRIVSARVDFIGAGDSSVLRYLADLVSVDPPFNLLYGKILAAYLVSVANRYIDGCGFGPDVAFIGMDGNFQRVPKKELDSYSSEFKEVEKGLAHSLSLL